MGVGFQQLIEAIASFEEVADVRTRGEESAFFEVGTGDGRSQIVMAQVIQEEGDTVVHMMSEVGLAQEDLYEQMLLRNLGLRHSRIALVQGEQGTEKIFALVYTYPLRALTLEAFVKAFGEVVFVADAMQRALYGAA